MNNNPSWKKLIEILTLLFLGLTAACAILGVIIGYSAVQQYERQNNAQMINTVLGSDNMDFNRIMMDKPSLQGLFALSPRNQDAKSTANQMLKIIIDDNNDNICNDWKDIPELYKNIYELKYFNNDNKKKLRNAFFIMEKIMDDMFSAFEAKNYHLITKEDYGTYTANLSEIGEHPLFLCAIYLNHRHGYITKKFAQDLKNRLLADPQRKRTLEVIYPDILKEDWVERVGKK